jgi:restriction system protein
MAVPDFQTLMLPVLREFADGTEHATKEIRERVAQRLALSSGDIAELLPSGQTRFSNRMAWAVVYMKQAALLESVRRGVYRITLRGREVLTAPPDQINMQFLERYPEYREFRARQSSPDGEAQPGPNTEASEKRLGSLLTPDEQIRAGYQLLRANLASQLLERVRQASPAFFENLVVELMVAMGYGGSYEDAAQVVGKSGDRGIDGVIKEDRLGLENIYVQAKRWEATVGRPIIQQFAGALHGNRARKGVVITTSNFSREAIEYAKNSQIAIVLIDGEALANYMIEFGVGGVGGLLQGWVVRGRFGSALPRANLHKAVGYSGPDRG